MIPHLLPPKSLMTSNLLSVTVVLPYVGISQDELLDTQKCLTMGWASPGSDVHCHQLFRQSEKRFSKNSEVVETHLGLE